MIFLPNLNLFKWSRDLFVGKDLVILVIFESFDISKQQKNTLLRRIDDTIKAIQKGKINKAKLKIEQFKKALSIHPRENEKDRMERERRNEREHEKERREHRKPKQLDPADVQTLLTMLNQLLDNLN